MGSLFCLVHLVQARSKQEKMHREPPSTMRGRESGVLCFLQSCLLWRAQTFVFFVAAKMVGQWAVGAIAKKPALSTSAELPYASKSNINLRCSFLGLPGAHSVISEELTSPHLPSGDPAQDPSVGSASEQVLQGRSGNVNPDLRKWQRWGLQSWKPHTRFKTARRKLKKSPNPGVKVQLWSLEHKQAGAGGGGVSYQGGGSKSEVETNAFTVIV